MEGYNVIIELGNRIKNKELLHLHTLERWSTKEEYSTDECTLSYKEDNLIANDIILLLIDREQKLIADSICNKLTIRFYKEEKYFWLRSKTFTFRKIEEIFIRDSDGITTKINEIDDIIKIVEKIRKERFGNIE